MKESEDELTPQERKAFAAVPAAQAPPAFLEQQTISKLKYAGLIRSSSPSRPAYALGLALACLVIGVAVGLWWEAKRAMPAHAPPAQFMLMLHSSADGP